MNELNSIYQQNLETNIIEYLAKRLILIFVRLWIHTIQANLQSKQRREIMEQIIQTIRIWQKIYIENESNQKKIFVFVFFERKANKNASKAEQTKTCKRGYRATARLEPVKGNSFCTTLFYRKSVISLGNKIYLRVLLCKTG